MKRKFLLGGMVLAIMMTAIYLNIRPGELKPSEFLLTNLEALATPEEGILVEDCVMPLDFIAQDRGYTFVRVCNSQTGAKIYPCQPPKKGIAARPTVSKCIK